MSWLVVLEPHGLRSGRPPGLTPGEGFLLAWSEHHMAGVRTTRVCVPTKYQN